MTALFTKLLLYILPPVSLFISLHYLPKSERVNIFPSQAVNFEFETFADEEVLKSAISDFQYKNDTLLFHSSIKKECNISYTGIQMYPHESNSFINISNQNYIDLTLSAQKAGKATLFLLYFINGISEEGVLESYKPEQLEIILKEKEQNYRLYLDQFVTASWWLQENNISSASMPQTDYSKLYSIGITNTHNREQAIEITDVSFGKTINNQLQYVLFVGGTMIYLLLSFLTKLFLSKQRVAAQAPQRPSTYSRESFKTLLTYLSQNYQNQNLTKEMVMDATSLTGYQINEILQDSYGMKYKQYINHMRITEAERLLKETNRQIADIGQCVGFFYANSFTRTFKALREISPREYRKLYRV